MGEDSLKHATYEWLLKGFKEFVQHYGKHRYQQHAHTPLPNPLVLIGEHLDIPLIANLPLYDLYMSNADMQDVYAVLTHQICSRPPELMKSLHIRLYSCLTVLYGMWGTQAEPALMRGYVQQAIVQYLERCYADWVQETLAARNSCLGG